MNWQAIEAAMAARQQREIQAQQYQAPPASAAQDDVNYSRQVRVQVGEYLQAGDCETAKALALRAGEIALAGEVKDYCAATPARK